MPKKFTIFLNKTKGILSDSVWSIAALMLINCVAQFLVYPFWATEFSEERYGNIIYVMSLVNTFAVSIGTACNYARMKESSVRETRNGDYNVILLLFSICIGAVCFVLTVLSNLEMSFLESGLVAVLAVLTMWRYYADVEYRLALNYKGYFVYYLTISLGYLLGVLLFWQTKLWPLALLPGEAFGLIRIALKGKMFKNDFLSKSDVFRINCRMVITLIATNIITNSIFNGDRLLLQWLINGSAVTIYYLASLAGKTMSLVTTPLNSVIIGYLSRFKGEFTHKMIFIFSEITIAGIAVGTLIALVGSHILIWILYPESYALVKDFFLVANLTQVVHFVTNVVTTMLLRIGKMNRQLVINVVYAIAFFVLCVPAAMWYGVAGFSVAFLAANVLRYAVAIVFCFTSIR